MAPISSSTAENFSGEVSTSNPKKQKTKNNLELSGLESLAAIPRVPRVPIYLEWTWDNSTIGDSIQIDEGNKLILNPGFSVGTTGTRMGVSLVKGQHHYFEIEMSSDVYGTDVMIGLGTSKSDLNKYSNTFKSLLGTDLESWGWSYTGKVQHGGKWSDYSTIGFRKGDLVGVHVDLWRGILYFYLNRVCKGPAFTGLPLDKELFPMVSSTAARTTMVNVYSRSYESSLQFQCFMALGRRGQEGLKRDGPPGLRTLMDQSYFWVKERPGEEPEGSVGPKGGLRRKKANSLPCSSSSFWFSSTTLDLGWKRLRL